MTFAQMQSRALSRLGGDGVYYTAGEVALRINEGQRLFAALTFCLESTYTLTLTANTAWYHLLASVTDFLVPLRINVQNGARLKPRTIGQLNAQNTAWQDDSGTPALYAMAGMDLLAITKQPSGSSTKLEIRHARLPQLLTVSTAVPEIPPEYHEVLIDYARHTARAKEGGQEFDKGMHLWRRYLAAAKKLGDHIRTRSLSQRYDRKPIEIELSDRSRSRMPTLLREGETPWLITSR